VAGGRGGNELHLRTANGGEGGSRTVPEIGKGRKVAHHQGTEREIITVEGGRRVILGGNFRRFRGGKEWGGWRNRRRNRNVWPSHLVRCSERASYREGRGLEACEGRI